MLEIAFRTFNSIAILDLMGNIDIDAANFIEMVGWCLGNGYREILCNFSEVNLVDYAGLSVLAIAYKDVLNHKGTMKLVNVSPHIRRVFSLVYMDRVLEIYEDEDFALRSFQEDKVIAEIKKKHLRRRFPRLDLDIGVEFKSKSKDEPFRQGRVLNISAVGMLVFAECIYPLGEILEVRLLLLPQPGEVELEARVVWLVEKELQPQIYPGMGLEFYNLDSLTQKKILEFVERNLPLGSTPDT
ncbi:MAG: PilZ domain-containing protein [Candidatus Omnitrophica bacterium]|nr:PilZ domain-containing protein [Candidatus Omnitrophota bacterium]